MCSRQHSSSEKVQESHLQSNSHLLAYEQLGGTCIVHALQVLFKYGKKSPLPMPFSPEWYSSCLKALHICIVICQSIYPGW
jgi:hypothetical protein